MPMKYYFFSFLLGLSTVNSFATDNDEINVEVNSPFDFTNIKFTIPKDSSSTWRDVRAATYNKIMDLKKDENLPKNYIVNRVKYHNNIGLVYFNEDVTSSLKLNELLPFFETPQKVILYFVARSIRENYWGSRDILELQIDDIQLRNAKIIGTLQNKWRDERAYINDNKLVDGVNKVLLNTKPSYARAAIIGSHWSSEAITEIKEMTKEFYPNTTESNPVVEYIEDFLKS